MKENNKKKYILQGKYSNLSGSQSMHLRNKNSKTNKQSQNKYDSDFRKWYLKTGGGKRPEKYLSDLRHMPGTYQIHDTNSSDIWIY